MPATPSPVNRTVLVLPLTDNDMRKLTAGEAIAIRTGSADGAEHMWAIVRPPNTGDHPLYFTARDE